MKFGFLKKIINKHLYTIRTIKRKTRVTFFFGEIEVSLNLVIIHKYTFKLREKYTKPISLQKF